MFWSWLWIFWMIENAVSSLFLWVELSFFTWKPFSMKCIGSGRESWIYWTLKGITDLLLLNCSFGWISLFLSKEVLISIGNAVDLPFLVPGTVFPKIEFFEIIRSLESLVDCCGFADTFRSLVSLISSCEACFSCCSGVNLSCWSLLLQNYQFLLDVMYLKCLENLFKIGKLLPWTEILLMGNLVVEQNLELNLKLK